MERQRELKVLLDLYENNPEELLEIIDDKIGDWHDDKDNDQALIDYLGFYYSDYAAYMEEVDPNKFLDLLYDRVPIIERYIRVLKRYSDPKGTYDEAVRDEMLHELDALWYDMSEEEIEKVEGTWQRRILDGD